MMIPSCIIIDFFVKWDLRMQLGLNGLKVILEATGLNLHVVHDTDLDARKAVHLSQRKAKNMIY